MHQVSIIHHGTITNFIFIFFCMSIPHPHACQCIMCPPNVSTTTGVHPRQLRLATCLHGRCKVCLFVFFSFFPYSCCIVANLFFLGLSPICMQTWPLDGSMASVPVSTFNYY